MVDSDEYEYKSAGDTLMIEEYFDADVTSEITGLQ